MSKRSIDIARQENALPSPPIVRWVNSAFDISLELWQECFPPPLEGAWWYHTLEKSDLDSQFKFAYAIIERDGKALAIAPAFLMDVPMTVVAPEIAGMLKVLGTVLPFLSYQRTLFVGSPCSDEGSVGLRSGAQFSDLVDCLREAVEKRAKELNAPMIIWKDFSDEYKAELSTMVKEAGYFQVTSFPGTMVRLRDSSKETYYAELKGSHRHNLKKKLKKSKRDVELSTEVVNRPDEQILDELFPLFWQTYEKGKTKFEKLNRRFFSAIADQDQSFFVLLRHAQTKQLLAFMLCFKSGHRVINKFIGIDYERPTEWYLYFRLWEAALDWVLTTGARELQSGQTGYRAKIDVGHSLVPLTNYCRHGNRIIQYIYSSFAKNITWSSLDEDLKVFLKAHPSAEA